MLIGAPSGLFVSLQECKLDFDRLEARFIKQGKLA